MHETSDSLDLTLPDSTLCFPVFSSPLRKFLLVKPHNFPGKLASGDKDPCHPKFSLETKSVTVVQISLVSHAQMAWKRPQFPFWFFPGGRQWRLPVALAGRRRSRAAEQFQVLAVSTSVRVASSSYALSISDLQSSQALDLNVARRNAWPSALQQYCLQSRQSCFVQTNWQLRPCLVNTP